MKKIYKKIVFAIFFLGTCSYSTRDTFQELRLRNKNSWQTCRPKPIQKIPVDAIFEDFEFFVPRPIKKNSREKGDLNKVRWTPLQGSYVYPRHSIDGPLIVFLDGTPTHSNAFLDMVGPLLEKNYRLAYYTRAGVGKYGKESDICPTQDYLETHVEDLRYFLEDIKALSGIKRVILLGHSMGTLVAHLFAAKYPKDICGLISSSSVPMDIKNAQLWDKLSLETCKKGLWDWENNSEGLLDSVDADSLRKRYNAQMMAEKRGSFLPYRKALNLRAKQWEKSRDVSSFNSKDFFKADLQRITVPTLLLHGREDKVVGGVEVAKYLQKNISNSELKIFDGGHDLDKEYPYEYFSIIDAFIQKIENKKNKKNSKKQKNINPYQ